MSCRSSGYWDLSLFKLIKFSRSISLLILNSLNFSCSGLCVLLFFWVLLCVSFYKDRHIIWFAIQNSSISVCKEPTYALASLFLFMYFTVCIYPLFSYTLIHIFPLLINLPSHPLLNSKMLPILLFLTTLVFIDMHKVMLHSPLCACWLSIIYRY